MRLNKGLQFAVEFARFASEMGIHPADLAQMIAAAERSKLAYERDNEESHLKNGDKVEELAKQNGCEVRFYGLWPSVRRTGKPETERQLPSQ